MWLLGFSATLRLECRRLQRQAQWLPLLWQRTQPWAHVGPQKPLATLQPPWMCLQQKAWRLTHMQT